MEGEAEISFEYELCGYFGRRLDESFGQAANMNILVSRRLSGRYSYYLGFLSIKRKRTVCILFFSKGQKGEDIFDECLAKRTGEYQMYHSGDINALHISYYRRMYESERAFQVANLRKSYGFHLTAQGGDPIPYPQDARPPYHMRVDKFGNVVKFYINDLLIFVFEDDGTTYGPVWEVEKSDSGRCLRWSENMRIFGWKL